MSTNLIEKRMKKSCQEFGMLYPTQYMYSFMHCDIKHKLHYRCKQSSETTFFTAQPQTILQILAIQCEIWFLLSLLFTSGNKKSIMYHFHHKNYSSHLHTHTKTYFFGISCLYSSKFCDHFLFFRFDVLHFPSLAV